MNCGARMAYRWCVIFLALIAPPVLSHEKILNNFDFSADFNSPCENGARCAALPDLINYALKFSYDSREEVERLFQARKAVLEKLGSVLPNITINEALGFKSMGMLGMASSMVGFLFPNRWIEWRQKKAEAKSELEAYKTLLGNRALAVQSIYYSIQSRIWRVRVYEHYISHLKMVIDRLRKQRLAGGRPISEGDLGVLEAVLAKLHYEKVLQVNNLSYAFPLLANSIGLQINPSHDVIPVRPSTIWSLSNRHPLGPATIVHAALDFSTELNTIDLMIDAAHKNKTSNYYDFFDPESGSKFGVGLGQRIKIARSAVSVLAIKKESIRSDIAVNVFRLLNSYNAALESFVASEQALGFLESVRDDVEDNIQNIGSKFDLSPLIRYFDLANGTAVRLIDAYFTFKSAEAGLCRATWSGQDYQLVKEYIVDQLEPNYDVVKKQHGFRTKIRKFFRHKSRPSEPTE